MPREDHYDADRHDSAAGWEPKTRNLKASARRLARELAKNDKGISPFEVAGAVASRAQTHKPAQQLFGGLWHEGEIAILTGPAASGKSVLAVQIANAIARGRSRRVSSPHESKGFFDKPQFSFFNSQLPPQKVLHIDFERTRAQFTERYSAPHPLPGKLPIRHRFPKNFIRANLGDIHHIPDIFKNDPHRLITYWLAATIEETGARVVVIDNISYLARSLTHPASAGRLIKTLKLWATRHQLSILATAHTRLRSSPPYKGLVDAALRGRGGGSLCPASLADVAAASPLTDLADTVFAIAPSTLAPDLRYIKHLKASSTTLDHDEHNVIVFQLTRDATNYISPNSSFITQNSPFLQLHHLGFSPESIHLTDPMSLISTPHSAVRTPQSKELRQSKSVVEMLMSREYQKYLER